MSELRSKILRIILREIPGEHFAVGGVVKEPVKAAAD